MKRKVVTWIEVDSNDTTRCGGICPFRLSNRNDSICDHPSFTREHVVDGKRTLACLAAEAEYVTPLFDETAKAEPLEISLAAQIVADLRGGTFVGASTSAGASQTPSPQVDDTAASDEAPDTADEIPHSPDHAS